MTSYHTSILSLKEAFFWSSLALNVWFPRLLNRGKRSVFQPEGKLAVWGFLSGDPVVLRGCLTGSSRAILLPVILVLQEALEAVPVEFETPLDPESSHSALNPLLSWRSFCPKWEGSEWN